MKTVKDIMKSSVKTGDLYDEYQKSLKDEKFSNLVEKLNIDSKVLMKYTSNLEESALEYDNCLHCKSLLTCKNKIHGFAYLPKVNGKMLTFDYKACKKTIKMNKEKKYQNNVYLYELPEDIKTAKISDIYTQYTERYEVITYINDFMKTYEKGKKIKGLYLHGNFGCGKTYLISACFNELAKKGFKSAIIFWPEFLRDLKTSFQDDFKEKFDTVKKAPLLLIDDIGAENTTAWERDEILCPILQYRMDEHLPTFFTSNLNILQLQEHLSISKSGVDETKAKRLIERIEQLTIDIEMLSNNLRK